MRRATGGILLVEDDELLASALVELLGSRGEVRWATSGEQAVQLSDDSDWDLIVSDVELPGMSGLDLVRRLKADHPLAATLILSSHASFDYAVAALRAGADDYMTKP
ncbi:MAG TPA: response regulator, partial [Capillimicrobium sp.]